MKIIISPAKKMNVDIDSLPYLALPNFLDETKNLLNVLKEMEYSQLKTLWCCNNNIATENHNRLISMDLHKNLTPAILSYDGIQYKYMAPSVFEDGQFEYINKHLRILSGFYGILSPFDGVVPYRLEMQAKLQVENAKNLYDFWGKKLAQEVFKDTDTVINLASKEYSKCISEYLPDNITYITCKFTEFVNNKLVEKGTMCKMARGEMVRFMAEYSIADYEKIKEFNRLEFIFSKEFSNKETYLFIKGEKNVREKY